MFKGCVEIYGWDALRKFIDFWSSLTSEWKDGPLVVENILNPTHPTSIASRKSNFFSQTVSECSSRLPCCSMILILVSWYSYILWEFATLFCLLQDTPINQALLQSIEPPTLNIVSYCICIPSLIMSSRCMVSPLIMRPLRGKLHIRTSFFTISLYPIVCTSVSEASQGLSSESSVSSTSSSLYGLSALFFSKDRIRAYQLREELPSSSSSNLSSS